MANVHSNLHYYNRCFHRRPKNYSLHLKYKLYYIITDAKIKKNYYHLLVWITLINIMHAPKEIREFNDG